MLTKIFIGLLVVVLVLVVIVAVQPSEFRVVRTTTIAAPAAAVFAQVNDFHNWEAWSPWAKLDPGMKQAYAGAAAGTGAVYTWAGNRDVGEGRMTITESRPGEVIRIRLEFQKPFSSTSVAQFVFTPEGNRTTVSWSMVGEKTFVTKAIFLFVSMDRLLGAEFEKGLAQMKSMAEAARPR